VSSVTGNLGREFAAGNVKKIEKELGIYTQTRLPRDRSPFLRTYSYYVQYLRGGPRLTGADLPLAKNSACTSLGVAVRLLNDHKSGVK